MSTHIRLLLIVLVVIACACARVGGAFGAHLRVSRATREAHEQAKVVQFARRFLGVRYEYVTVPVLSRAQQSYGWHFSAGIARAGGR